MLPLLLLTALLATALLAPTVLRCLGGPGRVILASVPPALFLYAAAASQGIWKGEQQYWSLPWHENLGINLDFALTPWGTLLCLLVLGVGTLVTIYGLAYLKGDPRENRFFFAFFLFMMAMVGLSLSDNLVILFLFWELTSVASYLLIGHYHEKLESRKSALDAMLVTVGGGLALLAGILLLGFVGGSYQISELVEQADTIRSHSLYPAIFWCVVAGALTKSAQFPFHFWLPGAMAAPAPVSAYLHSATMVKAGVFLLGLTHPILGETPLWHNTLSIIGAITMTWGALVAMVQRDLKRLLAFTTVSALGTLVMLLGLEHELALKGAVIFFISHAFYKGALFMVAGALEKGTGTRDVSVLSGLFKSYPLLGIAAALAALSMSGVPPFAGFVAKELLYQVKMETQAFGWFILSCGFVAGVANLVVAFNVGILPFAKKKEGAETSIEPNYKPTRFSFWIGPMVLAVGSLLVGAFPGFFLSDIVNRSVSQIANQDFYSKLKLWHGFNAVLVLSLVTLAVGVVIYRLRDRLWSFGEGLKNQFGWTAVGNFRRIWEGILSFCLWTTRLLQSGSLTQYVVVFMIVAIGLLTAAWRVSGYDLSIPGPIELRWDVASVLVLMTLAGWFLIRSKRMLTAILSLGGVGMGIAALFALYGAPDLMLTQMLVETLTLMLFALAICGLPKIQPPQLTLWGRSLRALVALGSGVAITLLTLKALDVQVAAPVSQEMAARSVPEAFGRNVVNVILVDFRALDTLGEVAVLFIAAAGVGAMARFRSAAERPQRSVVLVSAVRYVPLLVFVFAIFLLLRGHNEPGGGFIGGLVAAMSAILVHLATGDGRIRLLRMTPGAWMTMGLLVAVWSGVYGLLESESFMHAWWGSEFTLPAVGKVIIGTVLFFDLGVFAVVLGVVMKLYEVLASWAHPEEVGELRG